MSKIILLNGAGSSGKTSIARSIQYLSNDQCLTFGVDTFIEMTPYPSPGKDGKYFDFVPGENERVPIMSVSSKPTGDKLFGAMADFAVGNILIKDNKLSGVIDFGGTAKGDPACDLIIAWTYLTGKARDIFVSEMDVDDDIWLRVGAWALWKAAFELCNIEDKNSPEAGL